MNLKSGSLLWPDRHADVASYPPLTRDVSCDLAIIGGGITGALLADELSRRGRDVVLIDRRVPGHGSTSASTGLLMYDLDTPLSVLIEKVGMDHARRAYRLCFDALSRIEHLVNGLQDHCDLTPHPILYLASKSSDVEDIKKEYDARRAAGFHVEFLDRQELQATYAFDRPAGLWGPRALDIDPYRFTRLLLARSASQGSRVFGQTEVVDVQSDNTGVTLHTAVSASDATRPDPGPSVRCLRVIFATGYETPEFLNQKICALHSTWALATQVLPDIPKWKDRCLMWESARPYFYLRSTQDGRAVMGGGDERFKNASLRDALTDGKIAGIVSTFNELFPDLNITPEYAWAGTFAETKDGMPYIGETPEWPRGLFALGYGGNGITFSVLAAGIIADLATGVRNDDAEVFRFGR